MSTKIEKSIVVNAPVEQAWQVAAVEYDQVGQWASSVAISKPNTQVPAPEGANVGGRVCTAPGFGDVKETITAFDAQNNRFTYAVSGLPGFVTKMNNTWAITEAGPGKSKLTLLVDMDTNAFPGTLMEPIMRRKLASTLDDFTEEFKLWVEQRQISPAKKKLNAKQAKKAKK